MDDEMERYYEGGSIVICRLAPQDYHRFHSPVAGKLIRPKIIEGSFYTVNPIIVRKRLDVFTENKRLVCYLETEKYGQVGFIAIGATMVGSVIMTTSENTMMSCLQELGYFAFGGSTVVLLFKRGSITFDTDLLNNSVDSLETLVQVGDTLGMARP